jgi:RNA polymerase sigma factor (sigma-70 family)
VLSAARESTPEGREAMGTLCETYWYPLYAYLRHTGESDEDARDLIQAYFARFLEKDYLGDVDPDSGRFRSFLLASLKHFAANERDKARTLKRHPGTPLISLDMETADRRFQIEPADNLTPERVYEKRWATTVLELVLSRLRDEFSDTEQSEQFELLKGYLIGEEPTLSYRKAAAKLEMSEGAVKVKVHRLRRRFGELLRAEIAETVDGWQEVDAEMKYLLQALTS